MKTTFRSLLTVATLSCCAIAAGGCATEASVEEIDSIEGEDGDELSAANRSRVLGVLRNGLTKPGGELNGAAFLRRGDSVVFVVRRYVERGTYALVYADAWGRKRSASGRITDYRLKEADFAGSPYAADMADGTVDGTHLEALLVQSGGTYVPVTSKFETGEEFPLYQFASTDTNIAAIYCEAGKRGFTKADLGTLYAPSVYCTAS